MTNPASPQVNDPVHYVSFGTPGGEYTRECRAATITEAGGEWLDEKTEPHPTDLNLRIVTQRFNHFAVGLSVFNPTGYFLNRGVRYDGGSGTATWSCDGRDHAGGTWHYGYGQTP